MLLKLFGLPEKNINENGRHYLQLQNVWSGTVTSVKGEILIREQVLVNTSSL